MSRVKSMRAKREAEGWARVDLNIPPGPALEALERLTGGDPRKRTKILLELLERA